MNERELEHLKREQENFTLIQKIFVDFINDCEHGKSRGFEQGEKRLDTLIASHKAYKQLIELDYNTRENIPDFDNILKNAESKYKAELWNFPNLFNEWFLRQVEKNIRSYVEGDYTFRFTRMKMRGAY